MSESLKIAYAEYLDRMYNQSDDLMEVDIDTVPDGSNIIVAPQFTRVQFAGTNILRDK